MEKMDYYRRRRGKKIGLGAGVGLACSIVAGAGARLFALPAGLAFAYMLHNVMMDAYPPRIPVRMYHSVAEDTGDWIWGFLSLAPDLFEAEMRFLAEHKYNTIFLDELYWYVKEGRPLPPKSLALTFDDGYLDNWVNVYPILKKYGLRATIFVSPEFVDPTPTPRPNLEEVWNGKVTRDEIAELGYLSWAELRAMQESGVIDIQSHTMTHTWHFTGSKIIDFHNPHDAYPWLVWNEYPDIKYRWLNEDQRELVPWGRPVYVNDRAVRARRYFDDPALAEFICEYVEKQGGIGFFQDPNWRERLLELAKNFSQQNTLKDRVESDDEYYERVLWEVGESKRILEEKLKKKVDFLCWPGGAYTQQALQIAEKCGYLATTVKGGFNRFGDDPTKIARGGYITRLFHPLYFKRLHVLSTFIGDAKFRGNGYAGLFAKMCCIIGYGMSGILKIFGKGGQAQKLWIL